MYERARSRYFPLVIIACDAVKIALRFALSASRVASCGGSVIEPYRSASLYNRTGPIPAFPGAAGSPMFAYRPAGPSVVSSVCCRCLSSWPVLLFWRGVVEMFCLVSSCGVESGSDPAARERQCSGVVSVVPPDLGLIRLSDWFPLWRSGASNALSRTGVP